MLPFLEFFKYQILQGQKSKPLESGASAKVYDQKLSESDRRDSDVSRGSIDSSKTIIEMQQNVEQLKNTMEDLVKQFQMMNIQSQQMLAASKGHSKAQQMQIPYLNPQLMAGNHPWLLNQSNHYQSTAPSSEEAFYDANQLQQRLAHLPTPRQLHYPPQVLQHHPVYFMDEFNQNFAPPQDQPMQCPGFGQKTHGVWSKVNTLKTNMTLQAHTAGRESQKMPEYSQSGVSTTLNSTKRVQSKRGSNTKDFLNQCVEYSQLNSQDFFMSSSSQEAVNEANSPIKVDQVHRQGPHNIKVNESLSRQNFNQAEMRQASTPMLFRPMMNTLSSNMTSRYPLRNLES